MFPSGTPSHATALVITTAKATFKHIIKWGLHMGASQKFNGCRCEGAQYYRGYGEPLIGFWPYFLHEYSSAGISAIFELIAGTLIVFFTRDLLK